MAEEHPGPPCSWEEIEPALSGKQRWQGRGYDKPKEAPRPCPTCGKPCRWIYWSSPPSTWRGLCGVEGWIEICEECRDWHMIEHETIIS